MTHTSTIRRLSAVLGVAMLTHWAPAGAEWHSVEAIADTARQFVHARAGDDHNEVVVTAGFLDPRLTLPRCTRALEPFLRPGTELAGRVVVGVRCTAEKPWKVYLPVYVGILEDVMVTAHPLPRGHIIEPQDVTHSKRDVSALRGDFVMAKVDVVGRHVTSGIGNGVVIRPSMLKADVLVEKGQTVTLSVQSGSIDIQMAGIANSNGVADEVIEVRNVASGKIVEGRVRSRDLVEISLH